MIAGWQSHSFAITGGYGVFIAGAFRLSDLTIKDCKNPCAEFDADGDAAAAAHDDR